MGQNLFEGLDLDQGIKDHDKLKNLDSGDYKDGGHTYLMPAISDGSNVYPFPAKTGTVYLYSVDKRAYIRFSDGTWEEITLPQTLRVTYLTVTSSSLFQGQITAQDTIYGTQASFTGDVWCNTLRPSNVNSTGSGIFSGDVSARSVYASQTVYGASGNFTGDIRLVTAHLSGDIFATRGVFSGAIWATDVNCTNVYATTTVRSFTAKSYYHVSTKKTFSIPFAFSFDGYSEFGMFMEEPSDLKGGSTGIGRSGSVLRIGCPRNDVSPMLWRADFTDYSSTPQFYYWYNSGSFDDRFVMLSKVYVKTGSDRNVSFNWFIRDKFGTDYPSLELWRFNEGTTAQTRMLTIQNGIVGLTVTDSFYLWGLNSGSGGNDLQINPTTALVHFVSSTERDKTDIVDAPLELSRRVLDVTVKLYTRKSNGRREVSLIAEDLYRHLPYAVSMRDGLPGGFSWSDISPHMLKLIQDQERRLSELEATVLELKKRLGDT